MASPKEMREIIEKTAHYIDSAQYDKLAPFYAEGVVYHPIGRPPLTGVDQVMGYYKKGRVMKDSTHGITGFIIEGDKAAVQIEIEGTLKSGKKVKFSSVDIFMFEGNKIKSIQLFTDYAKLD